MAPLKCLKLSISIVYQLVCYLRYEEFGSLVGFKFCRRSTLNSLGRKGRKA